MGSISTFLNNFDQCNPRRIEWGAETGTAKSHNKWNKCLTPRTSNQVRPVGNWRFGRVQIDENAGHCVAPMTDILTTTQYINNVVRMPYIRLATELRRVSAILNSCLTASIKHPINCWLIAAKLIATGPNTLTTYRLTNYSAACPLPGYVNKTKNQKSFPGGAEPSRSGAAQQGGGTSGRLGAVLLRSEHL